MFLEAEEKTKAHVRGCPFHVLSSSEAAKNGSRSDTQLHRQLTPYPTEVTIFHTVGVDHHTDITHVTELTFNYINEHTACQLNMPISLTA